VPGAAERFSVQCGDTYRIAIEDRRGAVAIEWYAPLQAAQRHADVAALTGLAQFIGEVRKLAAADGSVRVAELAP
jgi:hypothetical protein